MRTRPDSARSFDWRGLVLVAFAGLVLTSAERRLMADDDSGKSAPEPSVASKKTVIANVAVAVTAEVVAGAEVADEPIGEKSKAGLGVGLVRPLDEVYLISTRHLCDPGCTQSVPDLHVQRHGGLEYWRDSDVNELLSSLAPGTRMVVYISGNRADWNWTVSAGLTFYRELVSYSGDPRPIRFVIWSWPADRIRGPLRDVRAKACRTGAEAYYLGWLFSQTPADSEIGLVGFSYGSRIIAGALHLLAGGSFEGRMLSQPIPQHRPVDVVMLAPAFRNDCLVPGGCYDVALHLTDRFLLLYNSCDEVLRNYRFAESCRRRDRFCIQALGYTGFLWNHGYGASPSAREQMDACCVVGREHAELPYLGSAEFVSAMRAVCLDPESVAADTLTSE